MVHLCTTRGSGLGCIYEARTKGGHYLKRARGSGLGYLYGARTKVVQVHLCTTRGSGLGYIWGEDKVGGLPKASDVFLASSGLKPISFLCKNK